MLYNTNVNGHYMVWFLFCIVMLSIDLRLTPITVLKQFVNGNRLTDFKWCWFYEVRLT